MQRNEIWTEYKVDANTHQRFMFNVDEKQRGFKITIDAKISETDKNIIFHLASYEESQKLIQWMHQRFTYQTDSNGQIMKNQAGYPIQVIIPRPLIKEIINLKTNMLEKTISLSPGSYTLMFDNSYSTVNAKHVWLHVIQTWDEDTPSEDLPIIEHMKDDLPNDVVTCLIDANNCFTSGHYNQCSVMLRKAIETAIKIKLQQSGVDIDKLLDKSGNELNLNGKMKLLRRNNLITQRHASDFEKVKWFGDIGAHGVMKIMPQDIKDNVEPKVRSFLVGLNLKA